MLYSSSMSGAPAPLTRIRARWASRPGAAHLHVVGVEELLVLLLAVRFQVVADADLRAGQAGVMPEADLLVAVQHNDDNVGSVPAIVLGHRLLGAGLRVRAHDRHD